MSASTIQIAEMKRFSLKAFPKTSSTWTGLKPAAIPVVPAAMAITSSGLTRNAKPAATAATPNRTHIASLSQTGFERSATIFSRSRYRKGEEEHYLNASFVRGIQVYRIDSILIESFY